MVNEFVRAGSVSTEVFDFHFQPRRMRGRSVVDDEGWHIDPILTEREVKERYVTAEQGGIVSGSVQLRVELVFRSMREQPHFVRTGRISRRAYVGHRT